MLHILNFPPKKKSYSTPFPKLLFSSDGRWASVFILSKAELGDINHHMIALPAVTTLTVPMRRRGFPPTMASAAHRRGT